MNVDDRFWTYRAGVVSREELQVGDHGVHATIHDDNKLVSAVWFRIGETAEQLRRVPFLMATDADGQCAIGERHTHYRYLRFRTWMGEASSLTPQDYDAALLYMHCEPHEFKHEPEVWDYAKPRIDLFNFPRHQLERFCYLKPFNLRLLTAACLAEGEDMPAYPQSSELRLRLDLPEGCNSVDDVMLFASFRRNGTYVSERIKALDKNLGRILSETFDGLELSRGQKSGLFKVNWAINLFKQTLETPLPFRMWQMLCDPFLKYFRGQVHAWSAEDGEDEYVLGGQPATVDPECYRITVDVVRPIEHVEVHLVV